MEQNEYMKSNSVYVQERLDNYEVKKRGGEYVECVVDTCAEPYTFLVLDMKPQDAKERNHNKKYSQYSGYISTYTGSTYPYCDEHYLRHLKEASPERVDEIMGKYVL